MTPAQGGAVDPRRPVLLGRCREGKLLFQKCSDCGTSRHPPEPMCGSCGSLEWETFESSGHGALYVDPLAPPEQRRRPAAPRGPRAARRGDPAGVEPGRPAARTIHDDDLDAAWSPSTTAARRHAVLPGGIVTEWSIIAGIGQTEFSKNSGRSELQLAAEACRAAILDAGLTPAEIDGMVTFTIDTNDELALMRNLGVDGAARGGRRRRGAARARAAPSSTRPRRSTSGWPTRCSCTARSTSAPVVASASRNAAVGGRAPIDNYSHVRPRHTGEDVRALVPALHARVRRDQRRLRPVHGGRRAGTRRPTRRRGSTSGRSPSTTTRRRGGSSSRSCASSTAARRATAASRS